MHNYEITIVLDRLRSAFNVGNIFRIADAVGAKEIICCGYTATPPHPKLEKSAMGADKMVKSRHFPSAKEAIIQLKKEGIECVCAVDTLENAKLASEFNYPAKVAIVLGNEALGIQNETLEVCDEAICLPMFGEKKSINVGNCAAVILFGIVS